VSLSDPIGDLLTRIRNGQKAGLASIVTPASRQRENLLKVLEREGYIRGFARYNSRPGIDEIKIELKYHEGEPVISRILRVSKPGRRVYSKVKDLPKVFNGLGISIVSTPRGVMSDSEARVANVGGEVLCQVF
jgi:small subunit ribosomal protein S8